MALVKCQEICDVHAGTVLVKWYDTTTGEKFWGSEVGEKLTPEEAFKRWREAKLPKLAFPLDLFEEEGQTKHNVE